MKAIRTILMAILFALPVTPILAQTGTAHPATGVVKSVDRAKSTVMLAHDPVRSLNWPAMTMPFTVKDKALLEKLPAGKKVQFEFVQQGKDYVITNVK